MTTTTTTLQETAGAVARRAELDEALATLQARKNDWLRVPLREKIAYARSIHRRSYEVAAGQVAAAVRAKGIAEDSPAAGEEWLGGPFTQLRTVRLLIESLQQIEEFGTVRIEPGRMRTRPDGQLKVEIFPSSLLDRLLYLGFTGELWMEPGVTSRNISSHVGAAYRERPPQGKVALVLGAGNVNSISPLDVVHKLFSEGRVVLLKRNPVNEYLGPFVEEVFADLIRDGYMRTVRGGADVGEYLCAHGDVEEIHVTGMARTHDLIAFGPGEDGAERKRRGEPRLTKRITSELGNVGPLIVMPGRWSNSDLQFQAENVATQVTQNCGYNCNATRVIITHDGWPQRGAFLDRLRRILGSLPERHAYYPGTEQQHARMMEAYPQAERLGNPAPGMMAPTLIAGLDPGDREGLAFTTESFCSIVCETSLPGDDAAEFLQNAVSFCNEALWGSLNASITVDPRTRRALGGALEEAVAGLKYGSVAVNHWPGLNFGLGSPAWGAYPGHTLTDIQSGIGMVHNAMLFDRPQKSVIYGPFRVIPKPPWFVTHRNARNVARRLVDLEARPGLMRTPPIVFNAIRG
jgi:acyl-CoA reductase-like NAD-dependent aldehyde dehydrogenase